MGVVCAWQREGRKDKERQVLDKGIAHGFTGIGVNQKGGGRFIHLDIAEIENYSPRPHIWSY